ncbi:MAG: PD-(D/E)XK nuclease family protein [Oscillospiraceae bacterium]|nr:PD-(D/E)XK nuclease family protein [Oscillospiraceae bacterium]
MLHFTLGAAGTGKTAGLLEKMGALARDGERLIYLVPEQYSFEAERQIYRSLGPKRALCVEVLSFTRLSGSVFRAYGGLSGTAVSKTGKYLLMSLALGEVREKLQIYRRSAGDTSFIRMLVDTCGELKAAGITCSKLERFAKARKEDALTRKITEISVIYQAYQSLIERGYTDPDDNLIRASLLLENNNFFDGMYVFVDGFTTFMAAEFEILGHVIAGCKDIWFAFTADGAHDEQRGTGVLSPSKSAIRRLTRLAGNYGVDVAEHEILRTPLRFEQPELKHIAEHFHSPAPPVFSGGYTGALEICGYGNLYGEIEAAASKIAKLVREEGYRYRDIAVIARAPDSYATAIESTFSRHGISYFMSVQEDIENKPVISCALHALNAVRSGFHPDDVLLFAKSPLLGLHENDVAELENYCYCWSVRGSLWQSEFTNNPRGLKGPLTEDETALLGRINTTRSLIMTPLLHLRQVMRNPDGKSFASGIFDLLTGISAAENLTKYAAGLKMCDAFIDEAAQLWDLLMDVLDVFATAISGHRMSAAKMCELFRLAVNAAEIASPPQTLDQVLIGGADRIRPGKIRAAFVIGANEDVFPAAVTASGVFSDKERGELITAGLEVSPPVIQRAALEKYFVYFALTLASDRLFVSFSKSDARSRELLPSVIILRLFEIFPKLPKPKQDILNGISNLKSAFEAYTIHIRENSGRTAALRAFLEENGYMSALLKIDGALEKKPHVISDKAIARELFGKFMRLSPSRVERFYKCPFSYFISDGLKIHKRHKVEFTGLESGSIIHHVLQAMVKKHGGKGLLEISEQMLSAEILVLIQEYLESVIDAPKELPVRIAFLFKRLSGMLSRLLRRIGEEFYQSEFLPTAFEMPIKLGEKIEPLRLKTADGADVVVEGIVDRVDVMNKNGRRYIRVVDYKSGSKSFALEDVLYGLNMQMLLYLFTIAENGMEELSGGVPAGVLYMPASESYLSAARSTSDEEIAKKRQKTLCMNGILLDDEEVLRGMERDIKGIYIPVRMQKDGKPDTSNLMNLAEMGALSRRIKGQILKMAEHLRDGRILACPTAANGVLACEYCDYKAVCGFEQGDEVTQIAKLDKDEVLKLLIQEEQHGAAMD